MKKAWLIVAALLVSAFAYSAESKDLDKGRSPNSPPATSTTSAKPNASAVTWWTYPEALKKSRKEKKHVFVHFTATWCGWCKKMERETYSDTTVIRLLNNNFVAAKVWGDTDSTFSIDGYKITERALAQTQFAVRSYPTLWFVSPTGAKIGPVAGYRPAAELTKYLEIVRDYKYDTTRTQNSDQGDKSGK